MGLHSRRRSRTDLAQFAATAESAKRWIAGGDFETMGEDIGVLNTTHRHS
ncbi:MAG TPA: hypothetical protein VN201_03105 [Roseateles sp.]|nr:hypothetical protein [Roseateles sp.]